MTRPPDRYPTDVLTGDWRRQGRRPVPTVPAEPGLVVEDAAGGFCGAVVRIDKGSVTLEDRRGARREFPLEAAGFRLDGDPVTLVAPPRAPVARARSASGSFAVAAERARVARAGRIYVEGRHDAELVAKVWGHDLALEGVVVEMLDGVEGLSEAVREFRPGPDRRLGVLVDHLVTGSKESRIAAAVRDPDVLVVGHPYVDIWQAVKPQRLGLTAWPAVPRELSWKEEMARTLGADDVAVAWRRVLGAVRTYADLEPTLLHCVEQLIDFVTSRP